MTESESTRLSECLTAFGARDYLACYIAAIGDAPQTGILEHPVLRQFVAICLQRLGQLDDPNELLRVLLDGTTDPWEKSLVQLTFGQVSLDVVLQAADSDERRCQATYYAGARLLTISDRAGAETLLRACARENVDCLEKQLAEIDLTAMSSTDAPEPAEQAFEVFELRAKTYIRQGRYDEGVRAAEEACDLARRTWGQDDVRFAQGLGTLMTCLSYANRTREGIELAPLAIDLARKHYGDDDPKFANFLNTIAYLHKAGGELDEASRLYQAAVDIWGQSVEHRLESAVALNNTAQIEVERGKLDLAETLFWRVLDMLESVEDEMGLHAGVVNNLALIYGRKGDFDAAERLHLQALDYRREHVGGHHPQYAESLNNLAHVYKDQRRFADAEPLFRQAAEILERSLGIRHPRTLMALSALLETYEATGQPEAANRLLDRIQSAGQAPTEVRRHVLHPVPGLTPLFQMLQSAMPPTRHEMESIGGAVDWPSPPYQRQFARLADDFVEGRYGDCLPRAVLLNACDATLEVLQMYLLCFAQIPHTGSGSMLPPELQEHLEAIPSLIADPWHSALAGLTLGLTGAVDVEELVSNDERFCQLLYYVAQRKMVEGRIEEALVDLGTCATFGVASFETWMAERILRAPRRASDRNLAVRVRQLNAATVELLGHKDISAALASAEEAWRLAAALEERSSERTLSHYNVALAAYQNGDLVRAESLLRDLVIIARGSEHPDRTVVAGALNTLGMIYTDLAQFELAEPALRDALEELRLAGRKDDADYAQIQGNLAEVYREMGDLSTAIRVCRQAEESKRSSLGREHPEYARTLKNLGLLYVEIGELQAAEATLDEADRIFKIVCPPGHPDLAASARALAYLYLVQRRFREAETVLRTALENSRSINGADTLGYAGGLVALAGACMQTGRLEQADQYLQESRSMLVRIGGALHPHIAAVAANLAVVHAMQGNLRGALRFAKESEEVTSRLLSDVFATASERQRLQLLGDVHLRLSAFLSLVAALGTPDDEVANAFDLVLRRKGLAGEAQSALRDGSRPELRLKIEHFRSLTEKIARKRLSGPGPEGPEAHDEMLASWTDEKERLEAELARAIPGMRLELRMRELHWRLVRSLLPEGTALVEFVRFNLLQFADPSTSKEPSDSRSRYWAFVLQPEPHDSLRLVDLGDADEIDQLVASYRSAVVMTGSSRHFGPQTPESAQIAELNAGTALRAVVFDQLGTALGETRRLLLCPDGELSRFPWEVLPLAQGRRLIDAYEISYLGVGRDLLRISVPSSDTCTEPLVIVDPDFDLSITGTRAPQPVSAPANQFARDLRRGGLRFDRLPGASREGLAVATMLGVQPITGAAATERAIKSCRHPAILHVATHGYFLPDPEAPRQLDSQLVDVSTGATRPYGRLSNAYGSPLLRSGLILAGANTWLDDGVLPAEAEDGILTAEDVSGIDLSGTELVTLSACETGLGSQHLGEGVLGLRRAFISAGARTVVMSLWQVPDEETQTLMTGFYQRLLRGEGRAAALRNAQLELRCHKPEPYYWGAFICQGDPEAFPMFAAGSADAPELTPAC